MKKTAVFIPAGGDGTRLAPLTEHQPKPCLPVYYDEQGQIIRLIDLQIALAKQRNLIVYVYTKKMERQFDYLHSDDSVVFRHADTVNVYAAYLQALSDFNNDSEVENMICLPSDVIMPEYVFNMLIDTIERDEVNAAVLCSRTKMGMITNANVPHYRDGAGFLVRKGQGKTICYDLGIYLSKIAWDVRKHAALAPDKLGRGMWKSIYSEDDAPEKGVAICLPDPDIKHLDAGTPEPYYEMLMKFNKHHIDERGNVVFPGAKINAQSTDVVALPDSDSSSIILHRAIVPSHAKIFHEHEALHVHESDTTYFNGLDMSDFPAFSS